MTTRAPSPPAALEVTGLSNGIEIKWETDVAGEGFRVYRKDPQSRSFGEPLAVLGDDARTHVDFTARFGSRYVYAVTSVQSRLPLVESEIGAQKEIHYRDRFAPGLALCA